jgi:hypothetical protein
VSLGTNKFWVYFKNITVRKIEMFEYMNLGERINKSLKKLFRWNIESGSIV